MLSPKNLEDLQSMITDCIEENIHLDYKAAGSLHNSDGKKSEIAKDVSAIANSDGGVIIYGVSEYSESDRKHLPEKINPINRTEFSKEWLENVIISNISPRIEGLIITPISVENEQDVVYVVEIPKGTTAHQNTKDFKYYRRYNFSSVPMLAHEIADVMNRAKNPEIELHYSIVKITKIKTVSEFGKQSFENPLAGLMRTSREEIVINYKLEISPFNNGSVYAQYINYWVFVPEEIVKNPKDYTTEKSGYIRKFGDNTIRDVVDYVSTPMGGGYPKYGPSRYDPILPGRFGVTEKIKLIDNPIFDDREILWIMYADNAVKREGRIKLSDIKIIDKNEER